MVRYSFSFFDLFPYIIFLIICLGLYEFKKNTRLITITLFLFMALRVGVGYDYYAYKALILKQVPDYALDRIEPLSRFLMDIAYNTHYQIFFIISSFIIVFFIYRTSIKLSEDPSFSIIVYILFPLFFLEHLSIVRNGMAIILVLYSLTHLIKKYYISFLFYIIIASLFHKSALIALFFIPAIKLENKKWNICFFILSFFIGRFLINIIISSSNIYMEAIQAYILNGHLDGGSIMTILINIIGIINLLKWHQVEVYGKNVYLLSIINWGVCIFNMFSVEATLSFRLSSYFLIFEIIMFPTYIKSTPLYYRSIIKGISKVFLLLIFISSFAINISSNLTSKVKTKLSALPYQTIFYYRDYYDF